MNEKPQVVILELHMPALSGGYAYAHLEGERRWRYLELRPGTTEADVRKAFEAGLGKPWAGEEGEPIYD